MEADYRKIFKICRSLHVFLRTSAEIPPCWAAGSFNLISRYGRETLAKRPFLPDFYACPADRTGVVKIFAFLELEQK